MSNLIRVGVIVSVLGAYLAWTLMAAEVLYIPAKSDDMPRFMARTNSHGYADATANTDIHSHAGADIHTGDGIYNLTGAGQSRTATIGENPVVV